MIPPNIGQIRQFLEPYATGLLRPNPHRSIGATVSVTHDGGIAVSGQRYHNGVAGSVSKISRLDSLLRPCAVIAFPYPGGSTSTYHGRVPFSRQRYGTTLTCRIGTRPNQ